MNVLSRQPLRLQIATVMCALLAALAAAAVWSSVRTRDERQNEVRAESASMAVIAAASLDQYLDALDTLASALVQHPAVMSLDRAACDRLFSKLLADEPLLTNIALRSTDGSVRGTGLAALADQPTSSIPSHTLQVFSTGQPVTSELTTGTVTGTPIVARSYPVRRADGSVIAALGFGLNLLRLQSVFEKVGLPEGSVVTIVDTQGRILARSREADKYVGTVGPIVPFPEDDRPGPALRAGPDGVERFYGDVPIDRGPWILSVGIPRAEVVVRLRPLFKRNVAIVTTSVALVLTLSLLLSHQTSRGLRALTSAVQRIAEGDLSPPTIPEAPNLEIAQLQNAFTTMAANLSQTHLALDRQVDQERKMREVLQSLQRQVVRQERLAAVGLLVSGVAHEVNNPLQAILGTVELLERQPDLSPETLDEIAFIKTQSGRAREIIRNLSRFGSQQSGPPSVIDLRDVVAEVVQLRRRDLENSSIALDVETSSTRRVYANFTELEQVTLNFVINAQQAIETSGRPRGRVLIRLVDTGKRVRLEVHDDGPGVVAEDEQKLFQPFFTTKPVGKGTGLGLSVSYGIIDSYGGTIGHDSNPWGGATFFFELPVAEGSSVEDRGDVTRSFTARG